ncbi:MAG: helix-turn-helix domain-containing protein [Bacteroidota bacterium]
MKEKKTWLLHYPEEVKRIQANGAPFSFFDQNRFTLLFIRHTCKVTLDFDEFPIQRDKVIALHPGELIFTKDYTHLEAFSFSCSKALYETKLFRTVFGMPERIFPISTSTKEKKDFLHGYRFPESVEKEKSPEKRILFILQMIALPPVTDEGLQSFYFVLLVHFYCKTQHRIAFYAKQLEMGKKALASLIKNIHGINPHYFITQTVLKEAKRLLVFSSKTVQEICYEVGFNDPAYFARFFKRHTGKMATQFRQEWRMKLELQHHPTQSNDSW